MEVKTEFTFRNTNLPECTFKFLADIRCQKKFCDIEFSIGEQRISAHRVILAAAIPLFREGFLQEEEIPVPDMDAGVFQCLIDYAYSCELTITVENVTSLLSGACAMHIKEVQDACCSFIIARMSPDTVLNFRVVSDELNLPQLKEFTDRYVKENFEKVSKTEKFLHCAFEFLNEIISKDDLNVDSEEKVLESVLRWVKGSVEDRKENLPELLRQVRMVLLKPLYLTDFVDREDIIRKSHVSRDLVDEARNYNLFPERREKKCSFLTKPRQSRKTSDGTEETGNNLYGLKAAVKYTVLELEMISQNWYSMLSRDYWNTKFTKEYWINDGGFTTLDKKVYFFHRGYLFEHDPASNGGRLLEILTNQRTFVAAVSLGEKIFICGGRTGGFGASNAVDCYDPKKNEWTKVSSLQSARWSLSAVSLGEYIYTLGGRDAHGSYDIVEKYTSALDTWQFTASMLTPRFCAGAAVFKGRIYVCGGFTKFGDQCTATAEVYDPNINKWKFISSLKTPRHSLTLVSFAGTLYAIGGYDEAKKHLETSEVYDSPSGKWKCGPSALASLSAAIAL